MVNDHSNDEDEIDLRELSLAIWSNWKTVAGATCVSAAFAIAFAVVKEPRFTAEAVFELKGTSSGPRIPSEYAGLAAVAGINLGKDGTKGVFDRVAGRDFIQRLSGDVELESDPFFSPPKAQISPFSIGGVRLALGLVSDDELSWSASETVTNAYRDAVTVTETKNGSVKVSVEHPEPSRAAVIANAIVERVTTELAQEAKKEQKDTLTYLSDQLADALAEMEATKKAVADFALANSLASPTAFAARSEAMFKLREDLRRAKEMSEAVSELTTTMTGSASLTTDDYRLLRLKSPIIDDVDFRRLVGVPEALDAWQWPPMARLADFESTLRDRIARIERSITELRNEAELYAASTEELAALEREAKVAEATYSVLIEQVKAQSLIVGFQSNMATIYQSATAPERPSSTGKRLIVSLGIILGAFVGVGLALVSALRGGKIYSSDTIFRATGAPLALKIPSLSRLKGMGRDLFISAQNVTSPRLSDLVVSLQASGAKLSIIASTSPRISPVTTAVWIANRLTRNEQRTAIVLVGTEFSSAQNFEVDHRFAPLASLDIEGVTFISVPRAETAEMALTSSKLRTIFSKDDESYDRVVVAVAADYAPAAVRAFATEQPFLVELVRPGFTLREVVNDISTSRVPDAAVSL